LDQVPAASLDADDPLDEENSDDPDSEDDTVQLLAELQRIKKERSMEQAKRVSRGNGRGWPVNSGNLSKPATFKDN
jgi:protein CWC15